MYVEGRNVQHLGFVSWPWYKTESPSGACYFEEQDPLLLCVHEFVARFTALHKLSLNVEWHLWRGADQRPAVTDLWDATLSASVRAGIMCWLFLRTEQGSREDVRLRRVIALCLVWRPLCALLFFAFRICNHHRVFKGKTRIFSMFNMWEQSNGAPHQNDLR